MLGALRALASARKEGAYSPAHVSRVQRDLQRALGAIQSVRRVSPAYDASDPDLQPTAPYERPPEPEEVIEEEVIEEEVAEAPESEVAEAPEPEVPE